MDNKWLTEQLSEASRKLDWVQQMLQDMMDEERKVGNGYSGSAGQVYEKLSAARVPLYFIEEQIKRESRSN